MKVDDFVSILDSEFYAGVPDSQLKALCNYLLQTYGISHQHVIAANEGNAVGLAAGYHLATGKVPVVYMQNSGEGNIINPVASLMNDKVYAIPCIFIIGWRGEPGVYDEPQHIYQGEITLKLLDDMDITSFVVSKETTIEELSAKMKGFRLLLSVGKQVAFVIRKGALKYDGKVKYGNCYMMTREEAICRIVKVTGEDLIVSTTGKASRELFEIREANGQSHGYDFLTVGSMGHSSSIALGIALQRPDKRVWILDGDGSVLMHMGSMALMGANAPKNVVHIVINNEAHETVGGMPTVAKNEEQLDLALAETKRSEHLSFIEVKCSIGARENLGRPTTTARDNKQTFMYLLQNGN